LTAAWIPSPDCVTDGTPLRSDTAASLAFPERTITGDTLRREGRKGRLVIEHIGKYYTTLGAIKRMKELCRVVPKVRVYGSDLPDVTTKAESHINKHISSSMQDQIGTGCTELAEAEQKLAAYIAEKYRRVSHTTKCDPSEIPVADVIRLYATDIAPKHSNARGTRDCLTRLLTFFGTKMRSEANGALCRAYARWSATGTIARRDLEYLRAAINHIEKKVCTTRSFPSCCQIVVLLASDG
jgi:hypothetical protein